MAIFNTNIARVVKLLLPSFARTRILLGAIIDSFTEALNSVYTSLKEYRNDVETRLKYNSQTCHLRGMLNDRFDPDDRFFWIENEPSVEFTMIKRNAEQDFTMMKENAEFDPTVMFRRDKIVYKNSFIVHAPVSLQPIEDKIKQSINDYKLATRTFKIIYY